MTPNPLIAELMNHKWAMEENSLKAFFEMNLPSLIEAAGSSAADNKPAAPEIRDGIATIKISGVLLKSVPNWIRFWDIEATGYDEINEQLEKALKNDEVEGIHLQVSSPGGMVDGLADTADAIFAARSQKPVTATIEDIGASAAYWLTSQARSIEAGRTAEVGSIGVYTVYADMSKRAEDLGIKIIVVKSGEYKGMGVEGSEITATQIEAAQDVVDDIADNFISAVAAGRGKKKGEVENWATGRTWIAKKALDMGLIDKVTVNNQNQNNANVKGSSMSTEEQKIELAEAKAEAKIQAQKVEDEKVQAKAEAAKAAEEARAEERERLKEFKTAFPDDLEFAMDACGRGLSVTEAKAELFDVRDKELKETTKKLEKAETKEKATGAAAIKTGDTDNEDQVSFVTAAKELAKAEKIKLGDAYKRIAREQPELYQAHIEGLGLSRVAAA